MLTAELSGRDVFESRSPSDRARVSEVCDQMSELVGSLEHRELPRLANHLQLRVAQGGGEPCGSSRILWSSEQARLPSEHNANIDSQLLDPVLLDFSDRRQAQKARFSGELFPAVVPADPAGTRFLDYFQQDKTTAARKGIVALDLKDLS